MSVEPVFHQFFHPFVMFGPTYAKPVQLPGTITLVTLVPSDRVPGIICQHNSDILYLKMQNYLVSLRQYSYCGSTDSRLSKARRVYTATIPIIHLILGILGTIVRLGTVYNRETGRREFK